MTDFVTIPVEHFINLKRAVKAAGDIIAAAESEHPTPIKPVSKNILKRRLTHACTKGIDRAAGKYEGSFENLLSATHVMDVKSLSIKPVAADDGKAYELKSLLRIPEFDQRQLISQRFASYATAVVVAEAILTICWKLTPRLTWR